MTDRPIIFSAPMVRALLAGRKTQTRRLATSPLRKCAIGDRLYVREAFAVRSIFTDVVEVGYEAHRNASHTEYVGQIPVDLAIGAKVTWPKARPSIHMPRWASRLTLIVEGVKVEPLQAISEADCLAEGPRVKGYAEFGRAMHGGPSSLDGVMVHTDQPHVYATPRCWYRELWSSLHTAEGQRWEDNPDVVCLQFRVVAGNIDQVPV